MMAAMAVVRFLHLLGVAVWLGGMIFLGAVAVPAARAAGGPEASRALIRRVARKFGLLGGAAWVVIFVTGFGLMSHRNIKMSQITETAYGQKILTKLILLLVVGVIVLVHSLWQGPAVHRAEEAGDDARAKKLRGIGGMLDGLVLVITLVILGIAATLIP